MVFQTVTAVNYLPLALVLAETLKHVIPQARLCILVTDASPVVIEKIRGQFGQVAEFIGCDDLGVDALAEMRRYYSVFEFSSACKVLALDYQLRKRGESECFFIDPDMMVIADFTKVAREIDKDIVVTYHALKPYPQDGQSPTEMELAIAGAVNGGFVYMRHSRPALDALQWLVQHTRYHWFLAPAYGMYCDQHWLNSLLQFYGDITGILRHPGVNMAYWNLHERPLRDVAGALSAGGQPAMLFHLSGFPQTGDPRLSKHSRRVFDKETEACLVRVISDYRQMLDAAQSRVAHAGIAGDLTFGDRPLPARMKLAEGLQGYKFMQFVYPTGRFARLGGYLDKMLAQSKRLWNGKE